MLEMAIYFQKIGFDRLEREYGLMRYAKGCEGMFERAMWFERYARRRFGQNDGERWFGVRTSDTSLDNLSTSTVGTTIRTVPKLQSAIG